MGMYPPTPDALLNEYAARTAVQKITLETERLAVGMTLKVTQGHRNCLFDRLYITPISGLS